MTHCRGALCGLAALSLLSISCRNLRPVEHEIAVPCGGFRLQLWDQTHRCFGATPPAVSGADIVVAGSISDCDGGAISRADVLTFPGHPDASGKLSYSDATLGAASTGRDGRFEVEQVRRVDHLLVEIEAARHQAIAIEASGLNAFCVEARMRQLDSSDTRTKGIGATQ